MIREAGDSALVLELEPRIDIAVNAHAIAVADRMAARCLPGVRDVVPTFRSVVVHFDPLAGQAARIAAALDEESASVAAPAPGRVIEVPVVYVGADGPDLEAVATLAGTTAAEVVRRHASVAYRVFMLGFAPGFPYLGPVEESIAAPRLTVPRLKVPAGSVGIAGRQTGIYPADGPGGWRVIGRTDIELFDDTREPPTLMQAGDTVRFVPVSSIEPRLPRVRVAPNVGSRTVTVLQAGWQTSVQDLGRWGWQRFGVPVAGAMDGLAHRLANRFVGNDDDAATLEVTIVGPELRFDADTTVVVCGADLSASVAGGEVVLNQPRRVRAGDVLRFGTRRRGARAYVACAGGVAVPRIMGSRSTYAASGMGGYMGRPLRAGDRIPLGDDRASASVAIPPATIENAMTGRGIEGVRLRVLPGPQAQVCAPDALGRLVGTRFTVSSESNRMGYRLNGGALSPLEDAADMISDATVSGGVQVSGSGAPILLMCDRQTTGGYPQVAAVVTADLPLAAQLAPGDRVEFCLCTQREAHAALVAQEAILEAT